MVPIKLMKVVHATTQQQLNASKYNNMLLTNKAVQYLKNVKENTRD